MCFLVAWQSTWNTVPATTVSPHIHFHIQRPFPELILKLLELTSSAVFARRSAFRTIDKRPSSTREKPELSLSLISKSASKKYLANFISFSWDIYRLFQISLGATATELKTKKKGIIFVIIAMTLTIQIGFWASEKWNIWNDSFTRKSVLLFLCLVRWSSAFNRRPKKKKMQF